LTLPVALQVAPEGDLDELVVKTRSPFQGATFANVGPALADRMHLDPSAEGVVVTTVPADSIAAQYGFQPGDIIVAVNGTKIARTRDLERTTSNPSRLWRVTIERGGQQISAVFSG
jgi:S1-C subfamily serine protease